MKIGQHRLISNGLPEKQYCISREAHIFPVSSIHCLFSHNPKCSTDSDLYHAHFERSKLFKPKVWVTCPVPFMWQEIMHFLLYNFLFNGFPHMHSCWVSTLLYSIRTASPLFPYSIQSETCEDRHISSLSLLSAISISKNFPLSPAPYPWKHREKS